MKLPFKVVMVASEGQRMPDWVPQRLKNHGIDFSVHICDTSEQVIERAGDANVIWVFGGSKVVASHTLPKLKRCQAILRSGSGTDNIPVAEATELGIVVANTPEAVTVGVAVHTIALLITTAQQIVQQDRALHTEAWDRACNYSASQLAGRTLGLIGFGRIAQLVAQRARPFKLNLIAFDPLIDPAVMAEYTVQPTEFDDLLQQSDFISLHCPLLDQTHHLIGQPQLKQMQSHAVLINTSRGPVIDEAALVHALNEKWIAAAALDVFESEPLLPDSPLLQLDTVILTPHISSYTDVFLDDFWSHSILTLIELSQNRWPFWCVNPNVKPRVPLSREQTSHSL